MGKKRLSGLAAVLAVMALPLMSGLVMAQTAPPDTERPSDCSKPGAIVGTSGPDTFNIPSPAPGLIVCGLGGDDTFIIGPHSGTVYLYGGPGRDTFCIRNNSLEVVNGHDGRDTAVHDPFDRLNNIELRTQSGGCPPGTTTTTTQPPVPCSTVTESGGEGTTVNTHELGTSGPTSFVFQYNAYSIPDEFTIRYEGNVIFSTMGPVSGSDTETVNVPAGTSTQIEVTVVGPFDEDAFDRYAA
jgi:hypothetical protein